MRRIGSEATLLAKLRDIQKQIRYEQGRLENLASKNAKLSSSNEALKISSNAVEQWEIKVREEIYAQRELNSNQARYLEEQRNHNALLKLKADGILEKSRQALEAAEKIGARRATEAKTDQATATKQLHHAAAIEAGNLEAERRIKELLSAIRAESEDQKEVSKENHKTLLLLNNSQNELNKVIMRHEEIVVRIVDSAEQAALDRELARMERNETAAVIEEHQRSLQAETEALKNWELRLRNESNRLKTRGSTNEKALEK